MDIRLAIDTGGLPKAPPGKRIESPPLKEEFEKELEAAKKEEKTQEGKPGEVAETEPNAQLQKLDSEEKKEETNVSALAIVSIPILVEQVAATQVPVTTIPVNPNLTTGAKSADICTEPTQKGGEIALQGEVDATKDASGSSQELLQLISAMQGRKGTQTAAATANATAKASENTLSTEIKNGLNITSVQSTNAGLVAEQSENTKPIEKAFVPNTKGEVIKTGETAIKGVSVDVSGGQLQGDAGNDNASDSKDKSSETGVIQLQGHAPSGESKVEGKPLAFNQALNNEERQRVVETLTKKIEEMSVRSVRNEVRVEMHPPEMGSVVVNLRNSIEGLTATLSASNEPLRKALDESRNDLAGALADRNIGQVRVEVRSANADTMNMGQQFNQSQSQNHGQNAQQQQPRHAVADHRNTRHNSSPTVEDKPVARRMATTLIDMEI